MLNIEITPEDVMALGKEWKALILADIPIEERLAGLKPEERLIGLKPKEVLSQYKPEEVLSQYKPEERLSGLEPYLEKQREEAERQVILRTIQRTLRVRFKLVPETLEQLASQLQPFNVVVLERLSEVALIADNLTEFEAELSKLRQ